MRILLIIENQLMAYLLLFMCICLWSCREESDALLIDETDEIYQLYDYYVDKYGNEGIVAYVSTSNSTNNPKPYKYLMVVSADETTLPWGPMGEIVMQLDTFRKDELRANHFSLATLQSMYSKDISRYPAQQWCFAKNHSRKIYTGSWRLPSLQELYKLFYSANSITKLNSALQNIGGKQFDYDALYWTCTEDFENYITITGQESDYDQPNRAVIQSPQNSTYGDKDKWLKKNHYRVRAIKYIYYYDYD